MRFSSTSKTRFLYGVLDPKIEDADSVLLADTVHSADSLLDSHRIPRQVVIDEDVAELEVASFASRFSAYEDLRARKASKPLYGAILFVGLHLSMENVDAPALSGKPFGEESLRFAELGEQQCLRVGIVMEQLGDLLDKYPRLRVDPYAVKRFYGPIKQAQLHVPTYRQQFRRLPRHPCRRPTSLPARQRLQQSPCLRLGLFLAVWDKDSLMAATLEAISFWKVTMMNPKGAVAGALRELKAILDIILDGLQRGTFLRCQLNVPAARNPGHESADYGLAIPDQDFAQQMTIRKFTHQGLPFFRSG